MVPSSLPSPPLPHQRLSNLQDQPGLLFFHLPTSHSIPIEPIELGPCLSNSKLIRWGLVLTPHLVATRLAPDPGQNLLRKGFIVGGVWAFSQPQYLGSSAAPRVWETLTRESPIANYKVLIEESEADGQNAPWKWAKAIFLKLKL